MKQSIMNMVWIGDTISPIEALCMKSFTKKWNARQTKCIQSKKGGVEQDVVLCDASLITLKKEVFEYIGNFHMFFSYPFKTYLI